MRVRTVKENAEVVRVAAMEINGDVGVVEDPCLETFSVAKLRRVCDPFKSTVWAQKPLTREAVTDAIRNDRLLGTAWGFDETWTWEMHVERVAYLVVFPSDDPIDVDLGVPSLGCCPSWPVEDGNHRLAAAIYRGDKSILVHASGDMELIARHRYSKVR